jgi:hypothetical protein
MDVKDEHPLKYQFTVKITVFSIGMDVNDEHALNNIFQLK